MGGHEVLPERRSVTATTTRRLPPSPTGSRSASVTQLRPPVRPPPGCGHPRRRCIALLVVIGLAFAAVLARLVDLQVLDPEAYADRGVAQRLATVPLPAERGSIFDRDGNDLALSVPQHTVWADPKLVTEPGEAAAGLATALGLEQRDVEERLTRRARFVYLARQVGDEIAEAVERLDVDGVTVMAESERFLPAGDLAASLLGTVDTDGRGITGLEQAYDERLTGRVGELVVERGRDGRTIAVGTQRLEPATRGDDLVLTIDRTLQFEVERALIDQVARSGAKGGTAVLTDPRTGEVLAMASVAAPDGGPPAVSSTNAALTTVFEPGSVNKIVTMAAALEEGLIFPDTLLTVPPSIEVSIKTYRDQHRKGTETWSPTTILAQSSNVGTITIAQMLNTQRVDSYLRRFGLDQRSGLDFPQEAVGQLPQADDWDGTSIGSIPIGQGISVTAMQMLGAVNTLANGGQWVQPSLVRATVDPRGVEHDRPAAEQRRVVSERTAEAMAEMMSAVVASGTGLQAGIEGYRVAGKTGTAAKPDLINGGYTSGAYTATFAGFVPAEDPQLSAIVVLDEPRLPSYYASDTAAPLFRHVVAYALRHLQIPPPDAVAIPLPPLVSTPPPPD